MRTVALLLVACSACASDTTPLELPGEPPDPRIGLELVAQPSAYAESVAVEAATTHLATAHVGCAYAWPYPVWLHNTGNVDLDGSVELGGPIALVDPAPARLGPGERAALTVIAQGAPVSRAEATLVARYRHGVTEAVAQQAFTVRIEEAVPIVDRFSVPELPAHHLVLVIDGSPETRRHVDAITASIRNLHEGARGALWARWTIALGSPGDDLLLDLGGGPVLEAPADADVLVAAAHRALDSGRTGDALGAARQALDALAPLSPGAWDLVVISAVDSLPTDLPALDGRGGAFLFLVGGDRCGGPPTPTLDAAARSLDAAPLEVCDAFSVGSGPPPTLAWSLSSEPVPASLRVDVDGVELLRQQPSGQVHWWWDAAAFRLRIAPFATPAPGSTVEVRYRAACRSSRDDFERR